MVEENKKEIDGNFVSLVISISAAIWHQLGKIQNPITGKIEKNLEQARMSIDLMEMLKNKTKGNLTKEEEKFLVTTLSDLQLNYVDELKREKQTAGDQIADSGQKTENKSGVSEQPAASSQTVASEPVSDDKKSAKTETTDTDSNIDSKE